MKIKTKFDIIKKIRHSKEGVSGNEIFFDSIKRHIFLHLSNFIYLINAFSSGYTNVILAEVIGYVFIVLAMFWHQK